jgi:hypothetical protein
MVNVMQKTPDLTFDLSLTLTTIPRRRERVERSQRNPRMPGKSISQAFPATRRMDRAGHFRLQPQALDLVHHHC